MKKLLFGFVVAVAAFTSQASYLWWEMNTDSMGAIGTYAQDLGLGASGIMAQVVAVEKNDQGEWVEKGRSETTGFLGKWYTAPNQTVDLSDFGSNYTAYSYYVEVVKTSDSSLVGKNNTPTAYSDLSSYLTDTLESQPPATLWHGGSGTPTAAPEPTSAMLMLLGVAGLALKRKQKKA